MKLEYTPPPKKPGKETKPRTAIFDKDGAPHWIWCDGFALACLEDMAQKLAAAEAELAKRNAIVQ